jgi:hypothetical protein
MASDYFEGHRQPKIVAHNGERSRAGGLPPFVPQSFEREPLSSACQRALGTGAKGKTAETAQTNLVSATQEKRGSNKLLALAIDLGSRVI